MRIALPVLLFLMPLAVYADEIVEEQTKEIFPAEIRTEDTALQCTGVSVRKKFGFEIYAIAHYADASGIAAAPADPAERRLYWQEAKAGKAFVIRFVFFVDEGNLRQACEESLNAAGYTGDKQEAFLDVFARDYPAGSEMKLIADQDGALTAVYQGEVMGAWRDPALVAALWQSWLGAESVVTRPDALVGRTPPATAE